MPTNIPTAKQSAQKLLSMQRARLLQSGIKRSIDELAVENRFQSDTSPKDTRNSGLNDLIDTSICYKFGIKPSSFEDGILTFKTSKPLSEIQKKIIQASFASQSNKVMEIRFEPSDVRSISEGLQSKDRNRNKLQTTIANLNTNPHSANAIHEFINIMFHDAINKEASDIHLKRAKSKIHNTISYRIDGEGEQIGLLSEEAMNAVFARIKGLANLDISDSNKAQDGRTEVIHFGTKIDLRVATIPCIDGERITVRIIDPKQLTTVSDTFQMYPEILKRLNAVTNVTKGQGGLVLVSGPTGSGKTTTLYSLISNMDRTSLNVMTTEDPVEFIMPLTIQSQINTAIGLDYPTLLRAQLRNDPDVILVGEIRDSETADITVRASDTGHMVLASFHTDDALSTISRFLSMMSPEFLSIGRRATSHTLKGVINQKLARKLCICAQKDTQIDVDTLKRFDINDSNKILRRAGCSLCNYSGVKGRTLIPEALFIDDRIKTKEATRKIIEENKLTREFVKKSDDFFYWDIIDSCKTALLSGKIDLEEALRITGG